MISFVVDYYTKDKLVEAYSGRIYLVFHLNDWNVLESIKFKVVNPPIIRTIASWPRIKRSPSAGRDPSADNKYARTVGRWIIIMLSAITTFMGASTSGSQPNTQQSDKRPKVRSVCVQLGHTW